MAPQAPPSDAREAAEQAEALFVRMLLKEVRRSMPEDGLFSSREMSTFQDMFDERVADQIAQSGQLGLADAIEQSITGQAPTRSAALHAYDRAAGHAHAHDHVHGTPVEGTLTSDFGHRHHPILHRRMMHYGVDIGAPAGTPIRALRDGVVTRSERMGTYGNVVFVDHGDGLQTRYAHARTLLVKPGERVQQGQTLATVGSTGRSTGPHLHFEVRQDGEAIDPTAFLSDPDAIHPQRGTGLGR